MDKAVSRTRAAIRQYVVTDSPHETVQPLQLVEAIFGLDRLHPGGFGDHTRHEFVAEHACHRQQMPIGRIETFDGACDHTSGRFRQLALEHRQRDFERPASIALCDEPTSAELAQKIHDEEWVALRPIEDHRRERRGKPVPRKFQIDVLIDVGAGQERHRQLAASPAPLQIKLRGEERMPLDQQLGEPVCGDDEQAYRIEARCQISQHIDRREVRPVQIVDEDYDWLITGDLLEERAQLPLEPFLRGGGSAPRVAPPDDVRGAICAYQLGAFASSARLIWLSLSILGLPILGCGDAPSAPSSPNPSPLVTEAVRGLAPTGKLRVALQLANPLNVIQDTATGEMKGVGFDLGKELAQRLGISFEPVFYPSVGALLDSRDAWDVAFVGFSPARAQEWDFTGLHVEVEFGYLVPARSVIATMADVDRPGVRLAVQQNSGPDAFFSSTLRSATLVRAASNPAALDAVRAGTADVMGSIKPVLFELSPQLPGSRVLDGRPGIDPHAMAVPKGRGDRAVTYARQFIENAKAEGRVQAAIDRTGVGGVFVAPLQ